MPTAPREEILVSIKDLYIGSDALGLAEHVRRGEVSARELVDVAIDCIEEVNPHLNAVVSKRYDYARELAGGPLGDGAFAGVPFLLKDLSIEWEGFALTSGCRFLKDNVSASTWELANRMRAAGLIPLGRTNVPELGGNVSTEPQLHGPTRNPWNLGISAGGSSGGAAAAVASRMVPIADASDGGGSIRVPASHNGLVGLKPSRGRMSFGPDLVDYWYGLVVYGCVSRTVRDTAAYLDALAGAHPGDPYALPAADHPYLSLLDRQPNSRLKIGVVLTEPDGRPLEAQQRAAIDCVAFACEGLGHETLEADFTYDVPETRAFLMNIIAVQTAAFFEAAAATIGRALTKADVEQKTWDVIELGKKSSGIEHSDAIEAMRRFARSFVTQLSPYDAVLCPILPDNPPALGWLDTSLDLKSFGARSSRNMYFVMPANITGQPALSLPLYQSEDGIPIGVQFIGRPGDEATLISLAGQLEQAMPWNDRKPKIMAS